RYFSGLVLDGQQKDRALGFLNLQAAATRDKLSWAIETRQTATLDAFRRSRADAAKAQDELIAKLEEDLSDILDSISTLNSTQCLAWQACPTGSNDTYGNHTYQWWMDTNGSIAEGLRSINNASCPCTIVFNTSSLEMYGAISATGELATTDGATEVAVWSFDQVYLGPEISVEVTGQRAMAILSRSTLVLNTSIIVSPGTLGGFPGGGGVGRATSSRLSDEVDSLKGPPDYPLSFLTNSTSQHLLNSGDVPSNNINGPGAGSLRYYLFTITTSADDVNEVCTSCSEGKTLGGCFHLTHSGRTTPCIPYDTSPAELEVYIESSLNSEPVDGPGPYPFPREQHSRVGHSSVERVEQYWTPGVGRVNVTSNGEVDDQLGRCWNVTFVTATGNVPEAMVPISTTHQNIQSSSFANISHQLLTGINASVSVDTLVDGNTLGGTFLLGFRGGWTAGIGVDATVAEVQNSLLALPGVISARVYRSDPGLPVNRCSDGLCREGGPSPGGGRVWTVELGTREGNTEPSSPTASEALDEGEWEWPEVVGRFLTGTGAQVELERGFGASSDLLLANFNVTQPFSIALGGTGASHGGIGGAGANAGPENGTPRISYSDNALSDLLGGSGGARGGLFPAIVHALGEKTGEGRGGAGGGAIEFAALNDVVIGSLGRVVVDGSAGAGAWDGGGGGGSGGAVLVAAGGAIRHTGSISARGGDGGPTYRPLSENGGGGGGGGRVALYAQSIDIEQNGKFDVSGGRCFVTTKSNGLRDDACDERRAGATGTLTKDASFGYHFGPDNNHGLGGAGAEGTNTSLLIHRDEVGLKASSGSLSYQAVRPHDGLEYTLSAGPSTPEKVTFYVKVAASATATSKDHSKGSEWGTVFALLSPGNTSQSLFNTSRNTSWGASPLWNISTIDHEEDDGNVRYTLSVELFPVPRTTTIGVGIIGGAMRHGSGYHQVPGGAHEEEEASGGILEQHIIGGHWYKVDIMLSWHANSTSGKYRVLVDDIVRTEGRHFSSPGGGLDRVGLYMLQEGMAWYDEIYIGPDFSMGFRCPVTSRKGVTIPSQGDFVGWDSSESYAFSKHNVMTKNRNFVSEREQYLQENGGDVYFDGDGMLSYHVDSYVREDTQFPREGGLKAGSLLKVPTENKLYGREGLAQAYQKSPGTGGLWQSGEVNLDVIAGSAALQGTSFWYGEMDSGLTDPALSGGVGACSTNDFREWRFEGIMLHYANLTDMVQGTVGPEGGMVAQQPKVDDLCKNDMTLHGNITGNGNGFVMWMGMSDANFSLGMSAVATSDYPDGPFFLRRTLYPDGNETRDQTVFVGSDNRGYLARTYYSEVEYVMPKAVMEPVWNSVHLEDGSVNYGLNYHRAFYNKEYDDYHDIYLQR
ncbi:unnamed protein product, partial [Choristocarpus tenellus]